VSDSEAIRTLGISRATFFRLLQRGLLPEPSPLNGTKRRWWTFADLQSAKDALGQYRAQRDSV
jgi:predicted DNA-binding transcriptional regulator AlpA